MEEKRAKQNKEAEEKEEEEEEEEEEEGKDKEEGYTVLRTSSEMVDPADESLGEIIGNYVKFPSEEQQRAFHAPVKAKMRLYQDLIGKNMPY
ncbi:hypothetical protein O1611_g1421 [Lasiodiplodia mahajangana]|uniref:Uncharacterized protein n=1 Tax=Lasiodiplodia mahajangana TaxID=1108764 RepID=A0ACC2JXI7_9PEZI|nr:hypothetical protein O1611_g1421 [Lasiodiplodia mahajangana]